MSVIQQPHALNFRTQYGLPLTEQDEEGPPGPGRGLDRRRPVRDRRHLPADAATARAVRSPGVPDRGHDGRQFKKAEQVHMCGNSVSPPPMAAIARANDPWRTLSALAA